MPLDCAAEGGGEGVGIRKVSSLKYRGCFKWQSWAHKRLCWLPCFCFLCSVSEVEICFFHLAHAGDWVQSRSKLKLLLLGQLLEITWGQCEIPQTSTGQLGIQAINQRQGFAVASSSFTDWLVLVVTDQTRPCHRAHEVFGKLLLLAGAEEKTLFPSEVLTSRSLLRNYNSI